jgi:hypothetical protein
MARRERAMRGNGLRCREGEVRKMDVITHLPHIVRVFLARIIANDLSAKDYGHYENGHGQCRHGIEVKYVAS